MSRSSDSDVASRERGVASRPGPAGRSLLALVTLAVALAPTPLAFADSHQDAAQDDAHIKYRQKLMSAVGAHMGAISDIVKYQLDMPGHVAGHASQLVDSSKLIAAAFDRRVVEGPTDAKLEIWKDPSGFEEAIEEFAAAAGELRTVASERPTGVGEALKALGKTCGGCHKPFRKPKEESYKNNGG